MTICYIGIGSNLGDRKKRIETAVRRMKMIAATKVGKVSRIIETPAQGGPAQGPFLNAVAEIQTDLTPYQLLQELQQIESLLGRIRTVSNGPRTIDLDILTFGEIRMDEPALTIPHPRILERAFVVVPLREIAPQALAMVRSGTRKRPAAARRKKTVCRSSRPSKRCRRQA
jgi:2-amino-4-hydroxy-6-hydroxymethyldihydropteridine diphosphokinase